MRILALALVLAGCGGPSSAPSGGDLDAAVDALSRGELDRAESMVRGSKDPQALRLRARILMLRNRNREAVELLTPLLKGESKDYRSMEERQMLLPDLALAYVRQDNFLNAAKVYAAMGETILARKSEALARVVSYSSDLPDGEVDVPFFITDPIPVVAGSVNGRRALFVIDTLLDEVVLDRSFAKAAVVDAFGVRALGAADEGVAKEVTVGKAVVRNVPVHVGEAMQVGTLRPDGAIGLQFLMHFDFTLDYRRSRLTLRKAGAPMAGGQPAYVVGDRYLLTDGLLNGKEKVFVGIGTSLKGVTLAVPDVFVQGGGEVRDFAAGPLKLTKPSLDSKAFPAGLENSFGVPVGFVLGHSALRGRVIRVEPRSMKVLIE
jgi:hypothetical protein